jgi:hypothetical protein
VGHEKAKLGREAKKGYESKTRTFKFTGLKVTPGDMSDSHNIHLITFNSEDDSMGDGTPDAKQQLAQSRRVQVGLRRQRKSIGIVTQLLNRRKDLFDPASRLFPRSIVPPDFIASRISASARFV